MNLDSSLLDRCVPSSELAELAAELATDFGDRVASADCVLRVSLRGDADSYFGARKRAISFFSFSCFFCIAAIDS